MKKLNKVTLLANLGKAPEFQVIGSSSNKAKSKLSTLETYRNQKKETYTTSGWYHLVKWQTKTDLATKYLHKGCMIYFVDKLKNNIPTVFMDIKSK